MKRPFETVVSTSPARGRKGEKETYGTVAQRRSFCAGCTAIQRHESREDGQPAEKLDLNELVSMNMWGLTPAFMDTLYDGFVEFLQNVKAGDIKAEYLLPVMIDALIQKGTAQVDVLETKDTWFGVTYQEDKDVVIKAFKELTEAGVYPNGLYK